MDPIRLVIVEDDPMVMEVNAEFITRIGGYQLVAKAFNGAEAFEVISRRSRLYIQAVSLRADADYP